MTPKFKIDNDACLFILEKYVASGHWLFTRQALASHTAPKPLKALENLKLGRYPSGIKDGTNDTDCPDCERVIPKRDGYKLINPAPIRVVFHSENIIVAYVYQCGDFEIAIQTKYVPLFQMGSVFAKHPKEAILILSGDTLNDELVGVVMPYRLDTK